jgi:molybdenum cofactor biosynthesis enzyme MoaA
MLMQPRSDGRDFQIAFSKFALLQRQDELEPMSETFGFGPAKYFRLKKRGVKVGLIGALSDLHFCERCNKMRLTCDGKLRPRIDRELLRKLICDTLVQKLAQHLVRDNYQPQCVMKPSASEKKAATVSRGFLSILHA